MRGNIPLEPEEEGELFFWEGHAVVKETGRKEVEGKSYVVAECDDGCTYDIPAELYDQED